MINTLVMSWLNYERNGMYFLSFFITVHLHFIPSISSKDVEYCKINGSLNKFYCKIKVTFSTTRGRRIRFFRFSDVVYKRICLIYLTIQKLS